MPELDPFEGRLQAALRDLAAGATVTVDPVEVAWRASETSRPAPWAWRAWFRTWTVWATLLALAVLFAALLGALALGGALRSGPVSMIPVPTATPGPTAGPVMSPTGIAVAIVRHPAPLAPTGIEITTARPSDWPALVAEPDGVLWAAGPGALSQFDPGSADLSVWTIADDPAFGSIDPMSIVPAQGLGV